MPGYKKARRSGYKKRRTTKKYRRGIQTKPMYKRQNIYKSKGKDALAVYVNPWSTATTNPKVPDGKCRMSTGLRMQAVREYSNDAINTRMEFVIFPGLACGLSANTQTINTGGLTAADLQLPANDWLGDMIYENHGKFLATTTGDNIEFKQETADAISKWRLVSQAVRFTLINNADENDGWFEAVRFTVTDDYGKLRVKTIGTPSATGTPSYVAPGNGTSQANVGLITATGDNHANIYENIGNLVENPSYVSGKLRDIHRYQFQLRPIDTDHDFNDVHRLYTIPTAAAPGDPAEGTTATANDFSHEAAQMKSGCVDDSYDLIYVRIHGRLAAATGASTPTRIMAHCVANHEVMYAQGAAFTRYHSETEASPIFKALSTKLIEGNVKAAWKSKTI
jgi:hypothetical protein